MAGKLLKIDNVFCSKINSYSQPSQAGSSFAGDGATATTGTENRVLGGDWERHKAKSRFIIGTGDAIDRAIPVGMFFIFRYVLL